MSARVVVDHAYRYSQKNSDRKSHDTLPLKLAPTYFVRLCILSRKILNLCILYITSLTWLEQVVTSDPETRHIPLHLLQPGPAWFQCCDSNSFWGQCKNNQKFTFVGCMAVALILTATQTRLGSF